jgi:hypothetical protein
MAEHDGPGPRERFAPGEVDGRNQGIDVRRTPGVERQLAETRHAEAKEHDDERECDKQLE